MQQIAAGAFTPESLKQAAQIRRINVAGLRDFVQIPDGKVMVSNILPTPLIGGEGTRSGFLSARGGQVSDLNDQVLRHYRTHALPVGMIITAMPDQILEDLLHLLRMPHSDNLSGRELAFMHEITPRLPAQNNKIFR